MAYDCETTGVSVEDDRIVTAAVVRVGGGVDTSARVWLINSGIDIPEAATDIHGVTTERAAAEGREPAEALEEIIHMLALAAIGGQAICAMNCRFDLTILDREARRHDIKPLTDRADIRVIDPGILDKHLHRYRKGSRRLDALCEHYGAMLDDAHEAYSDALAAARLAWVIGKKGRVVRRVRNGREAQELALMNSYWEDVRHDLDALHAAQVVWAADQAEGLAEYFVKQGQHEDAAGVRGDWPLVRRSEAVADAA